LYRKGKNVNSTDVAIEFDQESLDRLAELMAECSTAMGAHCGDDDD